MEGKMMDEQKTRLIRLLMEIGAMRGLTFGAKLDTLAGMADYLLGAGVLVPPAKVGDPLWWVCDGCCGDCDGEPGVHEDAYGIRNIYWNGRKWGTLMEGDPVEFGTQFAFLSRDEAEKWIEEHREEAVGNG